MRWCPILDIVTEGASGRPYLLQIEDRERIENSLLARGFRLGHIDAGELHSERAASSAVGEALEYPEFFRGSWDGFFDLLVTEFQERPRILAIGLLNADLLAHRDLRLFVNTSWYLFNATDLIECEGEGNWQLEFLFWGKWQISM